MSNKEDDVTESISLSFTGEDLDISINYTDPSELAILFYAIISGQLSELVLLQIKEMMTEDEYHLFDSVFTSIIKDFSFINKEGSVEEPLVKPSELFRGKQ